jgi:hypothetical protein
MVVHALYSSYLGGTDQVDRGSRIAQGKCWQDPITTNNVGQVGVCLSYQL